jgi:hypothetical protein
LKSLVITTVAPDATSKNQTGSTIWTLNIIKSLLVDHEITLMCPPPLNDPFFKKNKFNFISCPNIKKENRLGRIYKSIKYRVFPSVWSLYSKKTENFLKSVKHNDFQLCWLLDDYCGVYLPLIPKCLPTIYCRHYAIHRDFIECSHSKFSKKYLKFKYHQYCAFGFDKRTVSMATHVVTPTVKIKKSFSKLSPSTSFTDIATTPFIKPSPISKTIISKSQRNDKRLKVVYVGDMTFVRNHEGVSWFIKNVIPLLGNQHLKHFHFQFIGKNRSFELNKIEMPENTSIEFTGFINDLDREISTAQIAIIPVWGGSGIRLKTLTIIGSGLPTIATPDALEGLDFLNEESVITACNKEDFKNGLLLMLNTTKRVSISKSCIKQMIAFFKTNEIHKLLNEITKKVIP